MLNFWLEMFRDVWMVLTHFWYIPVGYLALYFVGAVVFLLSIKLPKNGNGQLVIKRRSFHYMIAHPVAYGKLDLTEQREATNMMIRKEKGLTTELYPGFSEPEPVNICPYFARLFHMLLFVWPLLTLYFICMTIIGSTGGLLFGGWVTYPKLDEEMFSGVKNVYLGKYKFRAAVVLIPLLILGLAIWRYDKLLKILSIIGTVLVYSLPALIASALTAFLYYKFIKSKKVADDGEESSVTLVKERFTAAKEKFCKTLIVE